jgi:NAD(P)-dependent dehydrogenase (short-subunit alcohol dehydrogenase family)
VRREVNGKDRLEGWEAMNATFGDGATVVTGAGSGIGAAVARHAFGLGMSVVLADVNLEAIEALAAEMDPSRERTLTVTVDVANPASVEGLAESAYEHFGDVRVLVNNAGVTSTGFLWDTDVAVWDRVIRTNLYGVFYGIRSFVPRMLAQGSPAYIANLASLASVRPKPLTGPYIASKHAILALTECLYQELKYIGSTIQVSAVLPGKVSTGIFSSAPACDGDYVADAGTSHRTAMRAAMGDEGLAPSHVASAIFDGLCEGQFWISPRMDELMLGMTERAEMLRSASPPTVVQPYMA